MYVCICMCVHIIHVCTHMCICIYVYMRGVSTQKQTQNKQKTNLGGERALLSSNSRGHDTLDLCIYTSAKHVCAYVTWIMCVYMYAHAHLHTHTYTKRGDSSGTFLCRPQGQRNLYEMIHVHAHIHRSIL